MLTQAIQIGRLIAVAWKPFSLCCSSKLPNQPLVSTLVGAHLDSGWWFLDNYIFGNLKWTAWCGLDWIVRNPLQKWSCPDILQSTQPRNSQAFFYFRKKIIFNVSVKRILGAASSITCAVDVEVNLEARWTEIYWGLNDLDYLIPVMRIHLVLRPPLIHLNLCKASNLDLLQWEWCTLPFML